MPFGNRFRKNAERSSIAKQSKYAVRYENDFLQAVIGRTQKAAETERRVKQKELASLQAFDNELDGLSERIKQVRRALQKLNSRTTSTEHFLSTVRQYTRTKKLILRMLSELIGRIEIHQAEKIDGEWVQKLTIYYN